MCGSAGTRGYYITYPRINEDFIANIGVNDPTKLKFYGICVSACPAALQVVCNNDKDVKTEYWPTVGATPTPFSSFTSSQLEQCVSYNNPALPAGPGTNGCAEIRANCWVTPQVTTSIMYRCVLRRAHFISPLALPLSLITARPTRPPPSPHSLPPPQLRAAVLHCHLQRAGLVRLPHQHCRPQ